MKSPFHLIYDSLAAPSENLPSGHELTAKGVRPRSLIWAFAVRCRNHWILLTVSMESKSSDETLHMRKMM